MKKHVLSKPIDDKVAELKDGLCNLSYVQNNVFKCKITDEECIVTSDPKECPAIKDEDKMHKLVYGRNLSAAGDA